MSDTLVPVAQYLRMSTEHQQYSMVNQQAAIEQYAANQGFRIVRTYADPAKSGLSLKNRAGLKQALHDVMNGQPDYEAILVYDVSRWGRFLDNDESAHYEFICKSSGVPVHYCAETFVNDGSLPSMIIKALKRSMAGEYSRELSMKVYYGLKRMAGLGFKQGGVPGYGLRRMLISTAGLPKQELADGQRKALTTERVVFAPGRAEEIKVIEEVYRLFLRERLRVGTIARILNNNRVPYPTGKPWTYDKVYKLLTHPKYNGSQVFGMTTQRLKTPARRLPREEWVCVPDAFPKVVDDTTFISAQRRIQQQTHRRSNDQLLVELRTLLERRGKLSSQLVDKSRRGASASTYRSRFGSLTRAYELIGYCIGQEISQIVNSRQTGLAFRAELLKGLHAANPGKLKDVRPNRKWRIRLKLSDNSLLSIQIVRSIPYRNGGFYWRLYPSARESKNITLIARLNEGNTAFLDYTVVRRVPRGSKQLHDDSPLLRNGARLEDFTKLTEIVRAVRHAT